MRIRIALAAASVLAVSAVALADGTLTLSASPAKVTYPHSAVLTVTFPTAEPATATILAMRADASEWTTTTLAATTATPTVRVRPKVTTAYKAWISDEESTTAVTIEVAARLVKPQINGNLRKGRSYTVKGTMQLPKATVHTPVAPSTMYRGRSYSIYGYVAPRHSSGTYLVDLRFYKKNSAGVCGYHHTVRAKRYYYSTTKTKYKATVSLPHTGRWRVRAVHSCSKHATSYSAYDYITVR
jgi:hypothetical protein